MRTVSSCKENLEDRENKIILKNNIKITCYKSCDFLRKLKKIELHIVWERSIFLEKRRRFF